MVEKVLSSVKKETDRQYFFSRLENPLWIPPLRERGYFDSPPKMKQLPAGYVQYPHWPELTYLISVATKAEDEVIDIVLSLPRTDNPRVYDDIIKIALELNADKSAKLLPKFIEYLELDNLVLGHTFTDLLAHWVEQENYEEALQIAERLIRFKKDPETKRKMELRHREPNAAGTLLEPQPCLDQWDYQEILEKGVRPLAEKMPYDVSLVLIKAVAQMISLGMPPEAFEEKSEQDYSEIWCRRLDEPDRDYQTSKELLAQTMAFACLRVFELIPHKIVPLDQELRKHRWKIFKRLRQHLYASNPIEETLPFIREEILNHEDYSKWEHDYEFQLMVARACEHFGPRLLSKIEKEEIFNSILDGPSERAFKEWMGERYSDEIFQRRRDYFHRAQLRPFYPILDGSIKRHFDELDAKETSEPITDESYASYGLGQGGIVTYRSPKTFDELASLTDQELLEFINEWDSEQRIHDDSLVEINIAALAGEFQSCFKNIITADHQRLNFWLANRDSIARPIYVAAIIKAALNLVKEKNLEHLDTWMEFSAWILTHEDTPVEEGEPEPDEASSEYPDWRSSRRAVVDLVDSLVSKETDTPISARERLASLLRLLCTQPDRRLDGGQKVFINHNDPIGEAINTTRSRAIESFIDFGLWVRRAKPGDELPELEEVLTERISGVERIELSEPECTLLAMQFGNLFGLIPHWATVHKEVLFPKDNQTQWRSSFGSYIRFNRPFAAILQVLKDDFEYALANLQVLEGEKNNGTDLINRLGQHLFFYYLWDVDRTEGERGLLETFYSQTNDDRQRWGLLFEHVGRALRNTGKKLDRRLTERVLRFFDWRFEIGEFLELQKFTFWLDAECLCPDWRLRSYSKILDLGPQEDVGLSLQVRYLKKHLVSHEALVLECFAKITDSMNQDLQMYISGEEAKPILRAGLASEDPKVRENAEHAREKLLRLGRFDYLDL